MDLHVATVPALAGTAGLVHGLSRGPRVTIRDEEEALARVGRALDGSAGSCCSGSPRRRRGRGPVGRRSGG